MCVLPVPCFSLEFRCLPTGNPTFSWSSSPWWVWNLFWVTDPKIISVRISPLRWCVLWDVCVCVYVCAYMFMCIYGAMCEPSHTSVYVCTHMYVYAHTCARVKTGGQTQALHIVLWIQGLSPWNSPSRLQCLQDRDVSASPALGLQTCHCAELCFTCVLRLLEGIGTPTDSCQS